MVMSTDEHPFPTEKVPWRDYVRLEVGLAVAAERISPKFVFSI